MERSSDPDLFGKCQTPASEAPRKQFPRAEAQGQEMSPCKSTPCVDRNQVGDKANQTWKVRLALGRHCAVRERWACGKKDFLQLGQN